MTSQDLRLPTPDTAQGPTLLRGLPERRFRPELHGLRGLAPAALVVVATTAACLAVMPVTRHAQLWAEARASLLYVENHES